jgi:hypothetical protein
VPGRVWRRILGWFLIVVGVLIVLSGAIAIIASYDPTTQDPGGTRLGGGIFIGFGLLLAGPGMVLVIKARSGKSEVPPKRPRPAPGLRKAHLVGSAASAVLLGALGVGAIIYSLTLDAAASDFKSAHRCTTPSTDANCYALRNIAIVGVDVSQSRSGETDTVHFVDAGSSRQVALHPGNRDPSVLRTGAEGVATLWQGKYTNLDVGGESFATFDNPVGQQGEWRLIGLFAVGLALLNAVVIGVGIRQLRKLAAAGLIGSSAPRGIDELLPQSTVVTSGYPGLPLVLHPIPFTRQVPVWTLLIAVPVVAIEVISLAHYGPLVQWGLGGGLALLLVALFGWQILSRRRAAIFVDDLSFGTVDGLGRHRSWPRGEATRVALRSVARGRRTAPLEVALVIGPDGHARMSVPARLYDSDSLRQFAAALRVPFDDDPEAIPIGPSVLEREIPGSVPWSLRHANALGAAIAIVLIASVSAFALLAGIGPTHR